MRVITASPETKLITGEELLALGDIGPCELVDGRIVPKMPAGAEHGILEAAVGHRLGDFVADRRCGWVMVGGIGIYTRRRADRVRGVDVAFISKERLAEPPKGFLEVAPDLVVEIMSPGDRWQEVREKLDEYFSIGVRWVWIVEPENRAVLVYRSSTEVQVFGEEDTLKGEGVLEGFELPVASLFAE